MKNMFSLAGKTVCVIGGTGFIGSVAAKSFAENGAHVFVGTRHPRRHKNRNKRIETVGVDIRYSKSIELFIAAVAKKRGKIDVWINCAWPKEPDASVKIENISADVVGSDVMGHLMGFYKANIEAFKHMKKHKSGVIINFGSIYGGLSPDFRIYQDTEIFCSPSYPMIKGGIHTFTKYLACYAAPYNIRVNAVCPGGVYNKHSRLFEKQYSQRVPMRRMAKPEEITGPLIFLASEASSYMTGCLLYVDGGLNAW